MRWTAEAKEIVANRLRAGDTAAQIGALFDVNRSAITGLLARDKQLAAIGFVRAGKSHGGGRTPKRTKEESDAWRRQYQRAWHARKRGNNVIQFPNPTRKLPDGSPRSQVPALRVVSNNVPLMVQDWLDKNGGPRRFERGETSDTWVVRQYLEERGITLNGHRGKWKIMRGAGRLRTGTWADVMEIVDEIRMAEGLQPFRADAIPRARNTGAVG